MPGPALCFGLIPVSRRSGPAALRDCARSVLAPGPFSGCSRLAAICCPRPRLPAPPIARAPGWPRSAVRVRSVLCCPRPWLAAPPDARAPGWPRSAVRVRLTMVGCPRPVCALLPAPLVGRAPGCPCPRLATVGCPCLVGHGRPSASGPCFVACIRLATVGCPRPVDHGRPSASGPCFVACVRLTMVSCLRLPACVRSVLCCPCPVLPPVDHGRVPAPRRREPVPRPVGDGPAGRYGLVKPQLVGVDVTNDANLGL
jgi:hypothetical protein